MESNVSKNEMPSNNLSDYLDRLEKSAGSNRDTDGLGTMAAGPFVVGSVEAINGEDGKEAPEFVATRHELKQLAEYWALERIEHDFDWFVMQTSGSSEWRWSTYVNPRLNRLAQVLGSEAMSKVHQQAVQAFRKSYPKISDADWRVFTEVTQEEQDAWRAKVFGEVLRRFICSRMRVSGTSSPANWITSRSSPRSSSRISSSFSSSQR
jgi:hypothetical protein